MTIANSRLLGGTILDEEIRLEERANDDGVARYNENVLKSVSRGDGAALKPAERLLVHWYSPLVEAIQDDQSDSRRGRPSTGIGIWGTVFEQVPAEKLAVITLHEMIGACMKEPGGVLTVKLANSIGRAVFAEINLDAMKDEDAKTRKSRSDRLAAGEDKKTVYEQERERVEDLTRRFRSITPGRVNWWAKQTLADPVWSRKVCTHVGARLIYQACDVCNASFNDGMFRLAFHRERKSEGSGKAKAFIRMDENALQVIEDGHDIRQHLRPRFLPMVVPPYPWSKTEEGGYVKIRTPFVSKPTKEQKSALEAANLETVHKALSVISGVGWRINTKLLDVITRYWQEGGGKLGIPHRSNVPAIQRPKAYRADAPLRERWADVPSDEKRAYKRESARVIAENIQRTSAREAFLSKLDIAERFREREAIYFPHQLDFRGRMYAIPIHLNHQGDDVCRGLLEFAEAKKPGARGREWLMIHAANLWGADDRSYEDRIEWAEQHMPLIEHCAANPITSDWWMHADESSPGACDGKPWQFLAACFALVDPDGAGARLPVQVDGSCNGLQHYTAMGRDEKAAPAVNMAGFSDKPNSTYKIVATETQEIVRKDSDAGNQIAANLLGMVGPISKPLVKQPVMTTTYGVTDIGAREQVSTQLKKRGFEGDELYVTSRYLAASVMEGIGSVCEKAIAIMDWIRKCAGIIARAGRLFRCTSPIGFPMVQPYRRWKSVKVVTILQEVVVRVENEDAPVHITEQINGSAPNTVHMLDATHLMMTAIDCDKAGTTVAPVHDSYWSHAATMDELQRQIRQNLVELYQQDVLQMLLSQWRNEHPDLDFPEPPSPGTLDLNLIKDSPYTFH